MSLLLWAVIVFLILIILNVGFWLGVWWWHERAKDNYKLAWFLVDDGHQTFSTKGSFVNENSDGVQYKYNNEKNVIIVPHSYGYEYIKHRRRIDVDIRGNLQYRNNKSPSQSAYNELIKALTLSNIGADIVKAVSSSKLKIRMIIIVAIVALIVGALAMNIFSRAITTHPPIQTTQQTTPTPKLPSSGEVK